MSPEPVEVRIVVPAADVLVPEVRESTHTLSSGEEISGVVTTGRLVPDPVRLVQRCAQTLAWQRLRPAGDPVVSQPDPETAAMLDVRIPAVPLDE